MRLERVRQRRASLRQRSHPGRRRDVGVRVHFGRFAVRGSSLVGGFAVDGVGGGAQTRVGFPDGVSAYSDGERASRGATGVARVASEIGRDRRGGGGARARRGDAQRERRLEPVRGHLGAAAGVERGARGAARERSRGRARVLEKITQRALRPPRHGTSRRVHQHGLRLETRVRTRDADVAVDAVYASDVASDFASDVASDVAFVPLSVFHPRERSRRGGEERVRLLGFVGVRLRVGGEREGARAGGSRRGRRRRQRPFADDPRAVMPGETPRV